MEEKPEKERRRSFKGKLSRVFFPRSRSSGEQGVEQGPKKDEEEEEEAGGHGRRRRRSWGSWRQKKSPKLSVQSSPVLSGVGRTRHFSTDSFTSLQTNDWYQAERVARDSKDAYRDDRRADVTESTELVPQSPNNPTGKPSKFQNIRFPSSGKAEEGKRNQVLDYLGGIFGSGRKKTVKPSPADPSSPNSGVEESPAVSKDLSTSGRDSPGEFEGSAFAPDCGREGLTEGEATLPASSATGNGKQPAASPEPANVTVIDISLKTSGRLPKPSVVSKGGLPSEVVPGNQGDGVLSDAPSALVGEEHTSLTPVRADDGAVKGYKTIEFIDAPGDEGTPRDSRPPGGRAFVGCDRLGEGQSDCETEDACADIPPVEEWVLPISQTVRIEQITRPSLIDVNHPKAKVNTKLSEVSVLLPVNRIGGGLKHQGRSPKGDSAERPKQSDYRAFRKEIRIHSAPEKAPLPPPGLVVPQCLSKTVHLSSVTNRIHVVGTGVANNTHVGEGTANLLEVGPHLADNSSLKVDPNLADNSSLKVDPNLADNSSLKVDPHLADNSSLKVDPNLADNSSLKVDPNLADNSSLKVDPNLADNSSLKVDPNLADNSSLKVDPNLADNSSLKVDPHLAGNSSLKVDPHLAGNSSLKVDPHLAGNSSLKVDPHLAGNSSLKVDPHLAGNSSLKVVPHLADNSSLKVDPHLAGNSSLKVVPHLADKSSLKVGSHMAGNSSLKVDPHLAGNSSLKVDPHLAGNSSLKVDPHLADNSLRQKLNGLADRDSGANDASTRPRPDLGNSKSPEERPDSFLGLRFDSRATVCFEMDKRSPADSKRGIRKERKRRSLKSDQCGKDAGGGETNDAEEALKENESGAGEANDAAQRSPESPAKMPPSPKHVTSPLSQHKIFPKPVLSAEKSTQGVSKPFASRKKFSQRASLGSSLDGEIDAAFEGFSEKTSSAGSGSSESLASGPKDAQTSGQRAERISQGAQGAVGDSTNNEAFGVSAPSANAGKLGGKAAALDGGSRSGDAEAVSCLSNQANQEPGADSERVGTQNVSSPKGKGGSKNVITSELRSTVTTRIRLPSSERKGESDEWVGLPDELTSCTDITTEEEETIRVTLPRKKSATSHHQVDFFTTKDLPLGSSANQTCVGSLKIQIQNKPTKRADGNSTAGGKRRPDVEAAPGGIAGTGHEADEVFGVEADRTKHLPAGERGTVGAETASVPVGRQSSETPAGTGAGDWDGAVSTASCKRGEVVQPAETPPPDLSSPGVVPPVATRGTEGQKDRVDGTAPPLVPTAPPTGAETQSDRKVPGALVSADQAASAKRVGETSVVDKRKTPEETNHVLAIKATALPEESPTTVSTDKEEDAANGDLRQRGRMAKGRAHERQSPPKSQPVVEDVSEAVPKTRKKGRTRVNDKRSTAAGELGRGTPPDRQTGGRKAHGSSPQPQRAMESAQSEIKADTPAEQLGDRRASPAEGASTTRVGSPHAQAGNAEAADGSTVRLEAPRTEGEGAKFLSDQKSDGPTGGAASPLPAHPMNAEREASLAVPSCAQTPEVNPDVSGNGTGGGEPGSNEAALGPALPLEQDVSTLQHVGPESKEKPPLPNPQWSGTAEAVVDNEVPARRTDQRINGGVEAKNLSLEPARIDEGAVPGTGQRAPTIDSGVAERQGALLAPAADGPAPVQPNSSEARPGEAATREGSLPQSEERRETQSEAGAKCFDQQKAASASVASGSESGYNGVVLGVAPPMPTPPNSGSGVETFAGGVSQEERAECAGVVNCDDRGVKDAPAERRQTATSTVPVKGTEPSGVAGRRRRRGESPRGAAAVEGASPARLGSSPTSQGGDATGATSPRSVGASNALTGATADLHPQRAANLLLGESGASSCARTPEMDPDVSGNGVGGGEPGSNEMSVGSQASAVDPALGKDVPANDRVDAMELGTTETRGSPVHSPAEPSLCAVGSGGLDANETASSWQSEQLSPGAGALAPNEGPPSMGQRGGSEETTGEFVLPLLSSTPRVQHQETQPQGAMPTLSLGASPGASSTTSEQRTDQYALGQNVWESRPGKVIVNDTFVDDACASKSMGGPDPPTAGPYAAAAEPTHSSLQRDSEPTAPFGLDASPDMDSFTETIRRFGSPIHLPDKWQRAPKVPPTPPFAMPPILEDHTTLKTENRFDPSTFKFGLKKSGLRSAEGPTALLKMQQHETKSKVPKRVSAENSLLFTSLSRKPLFPKLHRAPDDAASASDSKRSRLETGKALDQSPKPPPPTTTTTTGPAGKPTDLSPPTAEHDIGEEPILDSSTPASAETQLPVNVGRFLPSQAPDGESDFVSEKHSENGLTTIPNLNPNLLEIDTNFGAIVNTDTLANDPSTQGLDSLLSDPSLPSLFSTDIFPRGSLLPKLPEVGITENEPLRLNSRPGKIVIYSQPGLNGETFEFFHDVEDATSLNLPSEITIRIVRGCWLLYEKPNFEGSKLVLEEGIMELTDIWGKNADEDNSDAISPPTSNSSAVGSIKRIVTGWCLPEIDLCTELDGLGRKTTHFDEMEEIQTYRILDPTLSLEVFSGSWLLFEEPFYQGNSYFVEVGQYPSPESWGAMDSYISSLKPLKMGAMKVEILHEHKVIIYEKPLFKGEQLEIKTYVFSFTGEDETSASCHTFPFANVGSMKVFGGFWVGYEKPGFQGHQYALEEGEYLAWDEWGGYSDRLQSLRFIQVDLSNPVMIMYSGENFCEKSGNIEVLGPVPIMEETVQGSRTMSINVVSGTWVAYENTDFTGEQYVLEKGLYGTYEDWGAMNWTIASIQPVLVDTMDHELSKIKVKLFSEPELQGSEQIVEVDTVQFPDGFSPKSCEVLSGSWVAYDAESFTGNQYILEEGSWPDLTAMGCPAGASIKSVRTVNLCFSTPATTLFGRENFEGKRIELVSEVLNLKLEGYDTRVSSVKVNGGTWVAYECSNYRGRQYLLQPSQIPNWHQHTGWHRIGSLRPLTQRRVFFRVRNQDSGAYLTLTGELSDINMIRAQAVEGTGMDDQIWFYQDGYIKSKIAEDCCLDTTSSLVSVGSRLGVSVLHSKEIHVWNISSDGVIWSCVRTGLVIDIKGGQNYDKNHTILSEFDELRPTQRWDLDIL